MVLPFSIKVRLTWQDGVEWRFAVVVRNRKGINLPHNLDILLNHNLTIVLDIIEQCSITLSLGKKPTF
jgi:hypothetical protein